MRGYSKSHRKSSLTTTASLRGMFWSETRLPRGRKSSKGKELLRVTTKTRKGSERRQKSRVGLSSRRLRRTIKQLWSGSRRWWRQLEWARVNSKWWRTTSRDRRSTLGGRSYSRWTFSDARINRRSTRLFLLTNFRRRTSGRRLWN